MDWKVSVGKFTHSMLLTCLVLNVLIISISLFAWKRTFDDIYEELQDDKQDAGSFSDKDCNLMSSEMNSSYYYDFIIFTSFEPSAKRYIVHNNTKRNWPSLGHKVKAILFTNYSTLAYEFAEAGWDVLPLMHVSKSGTPILKYMFMEILNRYEASFLGYSNSDILFTNKLTQTLDKIRTVFSVNHENLILTGRRTNVENITRHEASSYKKLNMALKMRGVLYRGDAEDYFFTNPFYPWHTILDLVIGRVAYDNFILIHARLSNFRTIDLSRTVDAIHQTVDKGHLEDGWKTEEKEKHYNKFIIEKVYGALNYEAGKTDCLEYVTRYKSNKIVIYRNRRLESYCALNKFEIPKTHRTP